MRQGSRASTDLAPEAAMRNFVVHFLRRNSGALDLFKCAALDANHARDQLQRRKPGVKVVSCQAA
jgi:hypothetical protein